MNMCTSLWHTSARCYTLLAFGRFATYAPTSTPIGTSQWFPSLGAWPHLWRLFANAHLFQRCPGSFHISVNSAFSVFETCNFLCSSSLFDLSYRAKLWHFWKFLLDGLNKIWTTWCFSFHTIIMFPIGTCMTPNLQKCKLKKTQGQSLQFQRWWHPQTHHPSVNTHFWHCSCACMVVQSYVHTSVDNPTF